MKVCIFIESLLKFFLYVYRMNYVGVEIVINVLGKLGVG